MFYLLNKHQWDARTIDIIFFLLVKDMIYYVAHSNGHLFTCEDNILFLYVCEDIMFSLDRSPGVSSVFI